MSKALNLFRILTKDHKRVLPEKYAKVIVQVARLEERIEGFKDFGMMERAATMNKELVELLEAIVIEYKQDNKKRGWRRRR
jgi:nitrogen fixation/metabolism regulation signal transduction histidine kinase